MSNQSTRPTQLQMFYDASRKIGEANELFCEFVKEGMTREQLQRLIDRRPALWGRWANFLETLPSEAVDAH